MTNRTVDDIKPEEARRLWCEDLRSGKRKQGGGMLARTINFDETEYCCLGVACEVYIEHGGKLNKNKTKYQITYDSNNAKLPVRVREWLGLTHSEGRCMISSHITSTLSIQNDNGVTFNKIADLIESGKVETV